VLVAVPLAPLAPAPSAPPSAPEAAVSIDAALNYDGHCRFGLESVPPEEY